VESIRYGKVKVNVYEYEKAKKIAERLGTTPAKVLNDFEDFMSEFSTPEWEGDYCEEGCPTEQGACLLCVEGNDYRGYWG